MKTVNSLKTPPKVHVASPMLSGVLYAAIWLAVGALVLSALLRWGNLQEDQLPMYSMIVHALASFAGGFVAGKRSSKRGWYYGGFLGAAYGLLILLIGFLASNAGINGRSLTVLAETLACGSLGGMIGVNTRR
ncbi:TIGR04086 family membrane protein [Paenibacillus mendelii]|uniref:TIGR04086 family membrane protein n=1 Tax=Paenibacillus mendelii TaxID=206163 RepID=A0ABV6JA16_9BACL|nr:TIGR04086 family membrane protein [Paenibacillus mendelii]MCQ6560893.1 TIGR04086 family membrane protein [Paenibacillus mendelii]